MVSKREIQLITDFWSAAGESRALLPYECYCTPSSKHVTYQFILSTSLPLTLIRTQGSDVRTQTYAFPSIFTETAQALQLPGPCFLGRSKIQVTGY